MVKYKIYTIFEPVLKILYAYKKESLRTQTIAILCWAVKWELRVRIAIGHCRKMQSNFQKLLKNAKNTSKMQQTLEELEENRKILSQILRKLRNSVFQSFISLSACLALIKILR